MQFQSYSIGDISSRINFKPIPLFTNYERNHFNVLIFNLSKVFFSRMMYLTFEINTPLQSNKLTLSKISATVSMKLSSELRCLVLFFQLAIWIFPIFCISNLDSSLIRQIYACTIFVMQINCHIYPWMLYILLTSNLCILVKNTLLPKYILLQQKW